MPEAKTLESLNPMLTAEIERRGSKGSRAKRTQKYRELVARRRKEYDAYMSQRQQRLSTPRGNISPEGGMTI